MCVCVFFFLYFFFLLHIKSPMKILHPHHPFKIKSHPSLCLFPTGTSTAALYVLVVLMASLVVLTILTKPYQKPPFSFIPLPVVFGGIKGTSRQRNPSIPHLSLSIFMLLLGFCLVTYYALLFTQILCPKAIRLKPIKVFLCYMNPHLLYPFSFSCSNPLSLNAPFQLLTALQLNLEDFEQSGTDPFVYWL